MRGKPPVGSANPDDTRAAHGVRRAGISARRGGEDSATEIQNANKYAYMDYTADGEKRIVEQWDGLLMK